MPVTIKMTFPAGRFHATPWGRHVNEGVAEWPPSPWRLLRSFVAVWKRTCPELLTEQVQRILKALSQPPMFRLPPHRVAHTRHYMPWEKKGPLDRTLIFDTFVSIYRDEPLIIGWLDVMLSPEDEAALAKLVMNLTTLGRAESWVCAELSTQTVDWNCVPMNDEFSAANPVAVLCPHPTTAFESEHYPVLDPKRLSKGKINPVEYLFDCPSWHICIDTETVHANRWSTIPGSQWVNYQRPSDLTTQPAKRNVHTRTTPTVARFILDGPVLPRIQNAIIVAEDFRYQLMCRYQRQCHQQTYGHTEYPYKEKFRSPTFAGKDSDGKMRNAHDHAYYLPTADEHDPRHVRYMTVFASQGFTEAEVQTISALRKLPGKEDTNDIRVQLVGLGSPSDFNIELFQTSLVWESQSPYVGPAHIGRQGQERYLRKAIRREASRLLERQGIKAEVKAVTFFAKNSSEIRAIEYRRWRSRRGDSMVSRPSRFVRIEFSEPIRGLLSLGYAAHFGLGLFVPADRNLASQI